MPGPQSRMLRSHIGDPVTFNAPITARRLGAGARKGKIIDEVWAIESQRDPPKHTHKDANCWGDYAFCSQLIEWQEGGHSIRLAYYWRPCVKDNWLFAGQTTIETKPSTIRALMEQTLAKPEWFTKSERSTD